MKELIEYLISAIVDHPEEVAVEETKNGQSAIYSLTVHQDDIGKIIGKNGKIIQAIRAVAKIRAVKENLMVDIRLAE